ncbi:hypothetical protein AB0903_10035 [Streptomyces sp. NPDC048389]|uniref:hypothetical protein n=1 Tax=Streptomyces sp. NPDC048389 TaxID=3154622 RepID=UPI003455561F
MIEIPWEWVASLRSYGEESGRAVVEAPPGRAAQFQDAGQSAAERPPGGGGRGGAGRGLETGNWTGGW